MPNQRGIIFVVDDNREVRDALEGLFRVVGWDTETFSTSEEFVARPRVQREACLVLDIQLPGTDGLQLQSQLASTHWDMPIVFITGHGDIERSVRAMKAGAVEFLTKPFSDEALLDAVERGIERSRAIRSRAAEVGALRQRYVKLTARERQVMKLVISGLMNKEVAAQLGTREITVKVQRSRVMQKMEARSLPDLVRMAATLGIAPAD